MRITLGQLRRIIKEEVSRLRENQSELPLGRAGVSKAHRWAAPPDAPPPGFRMDPMGDGKTAIGEDEVATWNDRTESWDIKPSRGGRYSGPDFGGPDHSMDQAVGGRSIGNDWRNRY